jgi:hypothetical protein
MGIAAIPGTTTSSPSIRKKKDRFVDLLTPRSGTKSIALQDMI